ncbi:hypothetical protein ACSBR1_018552 [Camellia fascicularis]
MGGSGKTTLVAKAYNNQTVKQHFHCYAWITVSQTYAVDDLLRSMIKEFYPATKEAVPLDLSSKSHKELLEMICNYLKSKSMDDAWDLFCMKAFSSNRSRCCPKELESLAHDLVAKCEGLPLTIAALGGVMSTKHMESDWRKSYNNLSCKLSNSPKLEVVKTILLYSFDDLLYQLKHCLLYCFLFPEDYLIRRKRLIRLWIAEGFVEKRKGLTVEEVADSYLMDLVCRSMLQVIRRNPPGRPKECKMHDLVREIALSTSETEKFCVVYDGKETKEESGTGALWDLQDVPIEKLPNELVDLFNLRYLNLKRTMVKDLPKSIGRLCNLETLDIRDSKIQVLPTGITKLKKLRHLIMYRYNKHGDGNEFDYVYGTAVPANICKLTNLQALACVEAESDLMKRLRNMTQLKTPPYLKTLILVGKLEKVSCWFHSLQNITLLYLHWSRLEEDLLPYIQELPSLGGLILINACEGRQQLCFSTGFPKLRYLLLENLPQLNEIIIEKGVMPSLQEFWISKCIQLKMLPHGIEYLEDLQILNLHFVTNELVEQIRREKSEEHQKGSNLKDCLILKWTDKENPPDSLA